MQSLNTWQTNQISSLKKICRCLFGIISVKKIDNDILLIFPKYNTKLTNLIYQKRVNKKIDEILYNFNIDKIVLSKELKKEETIKNELYMQNLNILNGQNLFEIMLLEVLEYIAKKQNKNINDLEITILANDIQESLIDNIIILSDKVKILNIVTNNIEKFKRIEEKIREKFGILIRITNNKRKSLEKAKIIINIDFTEETVNQYNINQTAILINTNSRIKIYSKRFNGINIHDYRMYVKSDKLFKLKEELKEFEDRELYESILLKEKSFYNVRKKIEEDNAHIISLIGNNGTISEKEYVNFM